MPKKRTDPAQHSDDIPATELQECFGDNLRDLRSRAGLTQRQLADLAGITQTEVSRIELGKVNLTLGRMQRLAKAVDHDVPNLLSKLPKTRPKK